MNLGQIHGEFTKRHKRTQNNKLLLRRSASSLNRARISSTHQSATAAAAAKTPQWGQRRHTRLYNSASDVMKRNCPRKSCRGDAARESSGRSAAFSLGGKRRRGSPTIPSHRPTLEQSAAVAARSPRRQPSPQAGSNLGFNGASHTGLFTFEIRLISSKTDFTKSHSSPGQNGPRFLFASLPFLNSLSQAFAVFPSPSIHLSILPLRYFTFILTQISK